MAALVQTSWRCVEFTFEHKPYGSSCPTNGITVVALDFSSTTYPNQAGAAFGNATGEGARIEINKNNVGGVPGHAEHNWEYVAAHDGAHLVDLDDMHSPPYPSGCQSMSIMFFAQGPPPSSPCGDILELSERYAPPPVRRDEDGDGHSPDDEWGSASWDCDDNDFLGTGRVRGAVRTSWMSGVRPSRLAAQGERCIQLDKCCKRS